MVRHGYIAISAVVLGACAVSFPDYPERAEGAGGTGGRGTTSSTSSASGGTASSTTGTGSTSGGTTSATTGGGSSSNTSSSTASAGGGGASTSSTTGTSGTGGAPTSSSTTGVGGSGGCDPVACAVQIQNLPCKQAMCSGASCMITDVAVDTMIGTQTAADCKKVVCDGAGSTKIVADPSDLPIDTTVCTTDTCSGTTAVHTPLGLGQACTDNNGKVCDGNGACVACNGAGDCSSGVCAMNVCKAPTCSDGIKNGSETGVDCGGPACPICPVVLMLAGGGASITTGEYHPAGAWTTTTLAGTTVDAPALAITTAGQGVGLVRISVSIDSSPKDIQSTIWNAGTWTPLTSLGTMATTEPTISAANGTAQAAFRGQNYKHDYAAWTGAAWAPNAEPVGPAGLQSLGPSAPAIAALGADAVLGYIDNSVTVEERIADVWQAKVNLVALAPNASTVLTPSIVPLSTATNLLLVYVRSPDKQILSLTRTAGAWSVAAPVASAFTDDRVALVALPGDGAMLAFRGVDLKLYTSRFAAGAWSAPSPIASPNVTIASAPALAHGVGGAEAELAWVNGGAAFHSRFLANAWTVPVQIATGGLTRVVIASGP